MKALCIILSQESIVHSWTKPCRSLRKAQCTILQACCHDLWQFKPLLQQREFARVLHAPHSQFMKGNSGELIHPQHSKAQGLKFSKQLWGQKRATAIYFQGKLGHQISHYAPIAVEIGAMWLEASARAHALQILASRFHEAFPSAKNFSYPGLLS